MSRPPSKPSDHPFEYRSISHSLVVQDPMSTTMGTVDRYELVAQGHTRFFEHRYTWTGTGAEIEPIVSAPHRLHGPLLKSGNTTIFLIAFDHDLEEGESAVVEFAQRFIDRHNNFVPFLGKHVRYEIEKLELEVTLPPELTDRARPLIHPSDGPPIMMDEPPSHIWRRDGDTFHLMAEGPPVGLHFAIAWPSA